MIGKINNLNFKSLLIFNTFALLATCFFFNNFIFISIYIIFFLISLFSTKNGLKIIQKLNLLQNIRTEGPSNHFKKNLTPTMGGLFMIIPFLIFLLIINLNLSSPRLILLFITIFGFFITGFLDDFISIKNKKNTGLKSKEKFLIQSIVSIIFIFFAYKKDFINPIITVSDSWGINMNIFILPISFLVLVGLSNSVNLTDGLDGLAAGCSGLVFYGLGTEILIKEQQELVIFSILCYSMSGICLGFLKYNSYPAKIFMGDTGSLSLGGSLGAVGIITKHEIVLAIIGGLFVLEAVSVMVQVISFKLTGKRIFMMAPIHHHFEKKGWAESTVVIRFWIISLILAMIGLATLKLR